MHRGDGFAGDALNGADLVADLFRRLGGLAGQFLDLAGDNGKALAGLSGARRLDGRIQRQQVGLLGDLGNEVFV